MTRSTGRSGRWLLLLPLAAVALCTSGCITPATGATTYRAKAAMSVQAATSEVETARITVEALLAHRVFKPYADETVTADESGLGSISAAFGAVQPPTGTDSIHDSTTKLLSDAEDAVVAARIAVRRSDEKDLRSKVLPQLRAVSKQLDDAAKQLS
ncbi:MAG: hypothetical protein QOJ90_1615 [Actinomycetota bacterium]|nr:hypothetical protein [Actinomycetota bacterium]